MTPINALLADLQLDNLELDTFRNDTGTTAEHDGDYRSDPGQPWPPQ
jgi:hypothetical protein